MSVFSIWRIWASQCANSTWRFPAPLACRSALKKASYPTRLSLPATVSRLMSAIASSFPCKVCLQKTALLLHAFGRMEARIATIGFLAGPIWRHPAGPAQLTKPAEPDGLRGPGGYRELDIVFELLAIVEEHEVGQRLAEIAGRQETNILSQVLRKNLNPDFILNAENAAAQQRILAQHVVATAKAGPLGRLDDETQADELLDLGPDVEESADCRSQPRGGFRLRSEQTGEDQLGAVRQTVVMMIGTRSDSDGRTDIGNEAVCVGTVVLRDRARIRPCPEEQLDKSVVEQIEKSCKCRVVCEEVMIGLL